MTRFAVDLDQLAAAVGGLDAYGAGLATRLDELATAISALQQDWRGEAADAQAVAHRRIAAGAEELHAALLGLQAAARHAHRCYRSAVEANVATWRQVC
jgi:WXG100 family type VII secretion target